MIQKAAAKTIFLFLVLIGISGPVKSQNAVKFSPDTIVVYDTQIVYDTVFVYDTIRIAKPIRAITELPLAFTDTISEIKPLPYDTLLIADSILIDKMEEKYYYNLQSGKLLTNTVLECEITTYHIQSDEVLCELPATNLKKNIISVKTNNKLMKSEKYSTVKSDLYSWGMSVGCGGWWAEGFNNDLETDVLFSPSVGVYYERKVFCLLSLKVGLNYRWIATKGLQFSQDNFLDSIQPPSTVGIVESDIFRWDIDGENEDEFSFSQIDIPLKFGYKIGSFQPCIGFDYTRRFKHNKVNNGNYYNLIAGCDIHLSQRLSVALSYSYGLREEMKRSGQVMGIVEGNIIILPESKVAFSDYPPAEYVNKNSGDLSGRRFDISISYNLHSN